MQKTVKFHVLVVVVTGGDSLMDDDDDQKTSRILQAFYSAVCALHWKSKSSNHFSLSMWFKSLRSKKHFIIEIKGFNDEMLKCLSSDDRNHIFVAKNKAESSVNDSEDVMNCQYTGEIIKEVRVNGDQRDQDWSSVKVIAVIGEGGSGKTTMGRTRDVLAEIVKQIDQADFAGVETLSAEDLA
ncbi:hypothetical protein Q3G72_005514 [Acer saccharum]|nr:hypothetical protein Q3G72_005514 [Acer saccharum]